MYGRYAGRKDGHRRQAGRRRTGRWAHTYAALDLGTNNCRLLVAKPTRDGFRVVDAFSRVVRLGEGVRASGRLSQTAMRRTIAGLRICAAKMRRRGVTRARCVATEACRRADNCDEFLDLVRAETGLSLDIISTAEEARLAVNGCRPLLDHGHSHALVFDIGGGSTELMWLALDADGGGDLLGWTSLPCGVVTLAENYGGGEVGPALYERMVEDVCAMLAPFDAAHGLGRAVAAGGVQMLGTSGTVTTLAGVHLGLAAYDRARVDGAWLDFDEVTRISRRLAAMPLAERAEVGCVGPDRADLLVAGCAVVEAIGRCWPVARLRVADRGLREGLLLALMREADAEGRGRDRPALSRS